MVFLIISIFPTGTNFASADSIAFLTKTPHSGRSDSKDEANVRAGVKSKSPADRGPRDAS